MPLSAFSVSVPCTVAGVAVSVQVEAAATTPAEAVGCARLLAGTLLRLQQPGQPVVVSDLVTAGPPGATVAGLLCYVLGDAAQVSRLDFGDRLEPGAAARLGERFAGLQARAVIVDGVNLSYVSSLGLGTFAGNAQRLNLRLIRLNASVRKILGLVGVDRVVPCLADLDAACADLVAQKKD